MLSIQKSKDFTKKTSNKTHEGFIPCRQLCALKAKVFAAR